MQENIDVLVPFEHSGVEHVFRYARNGVIKRMHVGVGRESGETGGYGSDCGRGGVVVSTSETGAGPRARG